MILEKIETGQVDNCTTRCLLDYPYFKIDLAIYLSKQQKFDADPKAIQKINFTGNVDRAEGAAMFFIIEEAKKAVLDFPKGIVKILWFYFVPI